MTTTDPLLQPFQLKHLLLRNRLLSTAHEPAYSHDGMPKERYRRYHVEKAKGGIALTMTAGSAVVSRDSPAVFGNLHAYDDDIVVWLRELADECHEYGTAVMIQLSHLGRRTVWNHADWLPVLAPSNVREPAHRAFPKPAEDWDLERIIGDYADAAQRMQAAGLDGIEIMAGGHFLDQFWSPATNQRQDEYGGSLENRLRFTFDVLDAVRKAVGEHFIVGFRMVGDELWSKGLKAEEGMRIAQCLADTGQVDFLNVTRGHIDTDAALLEVIPTAGMPAAPHLEFAGQVRARTGLPILHAARINDLATARHALTAGKLDMVGMTRAHIADPHIVRKLMAGREQDIRPCVGATYCLDRIYEHGEALCIHNPATGREARQAHDIEAGNTEKLRMVIVGAGPAGLEAARVAAARGHQVTVLEAADEPGGQIRLLTRTRRRVELAGIIDWRVQQCQALGVDLRCNQWAEAEDVLALSPQVVIIATGGLPNTEVLDCGNELVISSWDILSGASVPGREVLLFDDHGGHQGMQAAELIAASGSRLEIVTPERFFAPEIGGLNHVPYARCFQQHHTRITINRRLLEVAVSGNRLRAHIGSDYGEYLEVREIDQVVVEHGTVPMDDLYFQLKPLAGNSGAVDYNALIKGQAQTMKLNLQGDFQLFRIGDAVAGRNIHAAIYDALRLMSTF